ncbi:MAG: hypothetical protein JXA71_09720 [Chitinispirillaceae bacterium]|nr:hypothetical protein [Chitinispirillaceae bacterium]
MIRKADEFDNKAVYAVDGEAGKLHGFLFYDEDRSWKIRYLVVALGNGMKRKGMLVLSATFASFDGSLLRVDLSRDDIDKCPVGNLTGAVAVRGKGRGDASRDKARSNHFLWRCSEPIFFPAMTTVDDPDTDKRHDLPLRSSNMIAGYGVRTYDGPAGQIEDFLIDDRYWIIRFLLVRPSLKLGNGTRLVSVYMAEKIDPAGEVIFLECGSDYMMRCNIFDPESHVNVSYDDFLKRYYMRAQMDNLIRI